MQGSSLVALMAMTLSFGGCSFDRPRVGISGSDCLAHSDCASDVCLADGTCALETQIVYLRAGGAGTVCSNAAPCGTLTAALNGVSPSKTTIRVSGTINNAEADIVFARLVVLGDSTTVLRGGGGGGARPMFALSGGARMEFYDVTLRDSRDEGITVTSTSSLTMVRSKVENAAKEGVRADGKVTLIQSEVTSCNDAGRRAINGSLGGLVG
jgi:hypothetical protein